LQIGLNGKKRRGCLLFSVSQQQRRLWRGVFRQAQKVGKGQIVFVLVRKVNAIHRVSSIYFTLFTFSACVTI
jgi:hypothetical protein